MLHAYINRALLVLCALYTVPLHANIEEGSITQWIKITTKMSNSNFSFTTNSSNFDISSIDCGYQCQIIKLSTTPFATNGTLDISLRKYCMHTTVKLPFNVENNKLVTPILTYHDWMAHEYCGFQAFDVIVTGSPFTTTGYQIELKLID